MTTLPSGWAQQQDQTLLAVGRNINDAIEAFNAMPQNPRYIGPLPYIGDDLASLSARMSTVDEWIGTVGKAFQQGGGDGWTSLPDATLTTMVAAPSTAPQSPPPTVQPGPSPSPLPKTRRKSGPGWKNYLEAAGWFALAGVTGAIGAYYFLDVAGVFVFATVDLAAPEGAPVEIPVEAVTVA
ncbi:MAG: hypothetical protein J2P38_04255 [Candidatus Dormibacteraeota bacterium]|nr:hypothetical protein [Candidatus Dormibacteraeota bacterium]